MFEAFTQLLAVSPPTSESGADTERTVTEAADIAAAGIREVSYATGEQATNIEEVTTTIQTVREHADETDAASARIIDTTRQQSAAVADLREQVGRLHGADTTADEMTAGASIRE